MAWGIFGLMAVVAILTLLVPAVLGLQRYAILGGSMEPAIPLGALVVVQPTNIDDVQAGNVITFQLESGKPAVATHRVVGEGLTGEGERLLVTQGDANDTPDIDLVRAEQVRGVVRYALPLLGWMTVILSGEVRMWLVPLASGALLLYAGWMFISAWRDRRRRLRAEAAESGIHAAY